jgi:hypothetical protein
MTAAFLAFLAFLVFLVFLAFLPFRAGGLAGVTVRFR